VCKDCGCGLPGDVVIHDGSAHQHVHDHDHAHEHAHPHPHEHAHDHEHPHTHAHDHPHLPDAHRTLRIERGILDKNDRLAERNRGFFEARGVYVVNVLASPGAGKTAFIERTAADLRQRLRLAVIVGDLATENDAVRLRAHGIPAIQITTGSVCHLDADMIAHAKDRLDLTALDVLVIENVGNLVCPAVYDLGENARVVLLSVTEGEDKPLKYPVMFQRADVVVINKVDIASAVDFDREAALRNIHRVAPDATVLEVSARTGDGMQGWYDLLTSRLPR
jgi:hydrogenase nickel incorporation protein HypB